MRTFSILGCVALVAFSFPATVLSQDSVFKIRAGGGTSKVNGKITRISADGVTIDSEEIPAAEIRKLVFSKEPREVGRARGQMESGRYADAIDELKKIKSAAQSPMLQQEIDFIEAYSTSQISLRGGNVAPQVAGKTIGNFIATYSDSSFHLAPAVEQYGKLIFAFGKLDLAAAEFAKLANSSWPEYRLKGLFQSGKTLTELGRYSEANTAFDAILAVQENDDLSQAYKLLAKCEIARLAGLQGNTDEAKQTIENLIRDNDPDEKLLFAHLYNALGATFEKSGQLKDAATAYLHTELLFATETEPHSEALYRLSLIWPQLEETDRANRSRNTLKTRYRNSYWAGKL